MALAILPNCSDSALDQKKILKLRPIGDRILVKVIARDELMENGLYKPEIAVERPQKGIVIAVGNGAVRNGERIPVDVTVGSVIEFGKYSGNELEIGGEKLLLLQESEIMGEYYDA